MVEALFRAYFTEGRNLADRAVLAAVASEAGMDAGDITRRLATDEDVADITAQIRHASEIGITGVPTFIVGNRYAVVGAQPPEAILQAVEAVARERDGGKAVASS
jgi:predicted DsbA family dithiol-disulfide isomerase